jgi:glucose-6-phosphate-specific signal transduction histidine kinase
VAMTREMSLTLLTLAATAWAAVMVVGGIWLLAEGPGRWPLVLPVAPRLGGVILVSAGQFLFMYLVADRWFPRAARAMTWPMELAATLVLVGGVVWFAVEIGQAQLSGI